MEKKNHNFFEDDRMDLKTTIGIFMLILVICGFFGFIYETIFYRIDLGYFVKRGSSFGPWVPIYAYGGVLLTLCNKKIKKHPALVFVVSMLVTGILEYVTGMVLWEVFHTRLWDYNTEIWNLGNINGYICLRSVLLFAISGVFLTYCVVPLMVKMASKMPRKVFVTISYVLGAVFFIDIIAYMIIR